MGGSTEYSSTSVGFGMFISKIPGFVKNTRISKLRSYNPLEVPKFITYMQSIDLYSEDEAEWMILYTANQSTQNMHNVCNLQEWIAAKEEKEQNPESTTLDKYRKAFCDYDDCKCGGMKVKSLSTCEQCLIASYY